MLISVENTIGAAVGDIVTISANSKAVLLSAAVLYMMPIILFFVGYLLGMRFALSKGALGCLGFVLGIAIAVLYDRTVLAKNKVAYTMTGFAENLELEG